MSIIINATHKIDDEKQWVYMTLKVLGVDIKYAHVAALGLSQSKLQEFVDAQEDKYKLDILKDFYPRSDHKRFHKTDTTELAAMNEWISKGHKNKVLLGLDDKEKEIYEDQIIEKQELEFKHPKSIILKAKIDKSTLDTATKDLLKEIVEEI